MFNAQETKILWTLGIVLFVILVLPLAVIGLVVAKACLEDLQKGYVQIRYKSIIRLDTKVEISGGMRRTTTTYDISSVKDHVLDIPAAQVWFFQGNLRLLGGILLLLSLVIGLPCSLLACVNSKPLYEWILGIVMLTPIVMVASYVLARRIMIKEAMYRLARDAQSAQARDRGAIELVHEADWPTFRARLGLP